MFGPLLGMVVVGDTVRPSIPGLAFVALLLLGLARGSHVAWLILLVWNAFVVLSVIGTAGSTLLLGATFLLLNGVLSLALLLSPSMRRHLGAQRPPSVIAR
jgi:hypothetical protein